MTPDHTPRLDPDPPLHLRPAIRVTICPMQRRDLFEMMPIEQGCFEYPMSEDQLLSIIRGIGIGNVAVYDGLVVGFSIHCLHLDWLRLIDFAVHPEYHRHGVGRQMMAGMVERLSPGRRTRIELLVRETNLPGQFFFRAMGFRAMAVVRGHYPDTGESAYAMEYVMQEKVPLPVWKKWRSLG